MQGVNHLADAVRTERLARGWSIRRAVAESGNLITNTWWGKFEDGQQPLTSSIRDAVAAAFEWSDDWPETRSSANGSADYVTRSEFDQLKERIRGVATVVDRMERALREAGVIGGTPPHGQGRPSA